MELVEKAAKHIKENDLTISEDPIVIVFNDATLEITKVDKELKVDVTSYEPWQIIKADESLELLTEEG